MQKTYYGNPAEQQGFWSGEVQTAVRTVKPIRKWLSKLVVLENDQEQPAKLCCHHDRDISKYRESQEQKINFLRTFHDVLTSLPKQSLYSRIRTHQTLIGQQERHEPKLALLFWMLDRF